MGGAAGSRPSLTTAPARRQTRVALVAGSLVVLGVVLSLLMAHRANLRLLAEKEAEAERKEAEVAALADAMHRNLEASQDPTQAASDVADVLEENERVSRRLPELLQRIGAIDQDKVEVRNSELGSELLTLSGCASGPEAVRAVAESFSNLDYLARQPDPEDSPGASACTDPARPVTFALKWLIQKNSAASIAPTPAAGASLD
jgi:hypothetical protein